MRVGRRGGTNLGGWDGTVIYKGPVIRAESTKYQLNTIEVQRLVPL